MTRPYLGSRCTPCGGVSSGRCACSRSCSGVMPVTPSMLRAAEHEERLPARGIGARRRKRKGGQLSVPSHSLRRVGNETGAQPHDTAPDAGGPEIPDPAASAGGADAERPARPSLSPSRAGDFLTCPLLYRFRVIDRLPEPPSPAAVRGTLVHSVLERLFDAAAAG